MYAVVRQFLERLGSTQEEMITFESSDTRVAMAVLLFRVIQADGRVRESEVQRYRELLQDHLDVSPDELDLFEKVVRQTSENESSLFPFTTVVSRMPMDMRRRIVDMMRDISISDAELHEFEINLVARTAELLGVKLEE